LGCVLACLFWGLVAHDVYLSSNGLLTRGIICFSEGNIIIPLYGRLCKQPEGIFQVN
jgi:hypothetical protein